MTIKARLLLAVVGGIILLFSASFYATNELNKANDDYNAEASITSYTSAWFGSLDGGYVNNLETFDPVLGSFEKIGFWEYDSDPFDGSAGTNPLHKAFEEGDYSAVSDYLDRVFVDAVDNETITFVTAYSPSAAVLYCNSSLYLVGVDPCTDKASPVFLSNFTVLVTSVGGDSVFEFWHNHTVSVATRFRFRLI